MQKTRSERLPVLMMALATRPSENWIVAPNISCDKKGNAQKMQKAYRRKIFSHVTERHRG